MKAWRCRSGWFVLCALLAGTLVAQPDPDRFEFALPVQPLTKSLQEFSEITDIAALGQTSSLERKTAPAVSGFLTAPQALDLLLQGSDLRYRFTGRQVVAVFADVREAPPIRGLPRALLADEVVNLEKMEVIGRRATGEYAWKRSRSATRTDTAILDVPQAITVVTRDLIDDQAMRTMGDVVRYIPGIGIAQGEGNRDAPVFRGSNSSASFFIDGLRDDVDYFRDFYNVERIEALKGPNAMIFGRGGPGGLINRVTKQAGWAPVQEAKLELGSWKERRATADLGWVVTEALATRINVLHEDSDSYREGVALERRGLNPTAVARLGEGTTVRVGYEHFRDDRVNDRGIPSHQGRPLHTRAGAFFGDPDWNASHAAVDAAYMLVERQAGGGLTLRNATSFARYGKYYQNVLPVGVTSDGARAELIAYSSATGRDHFFNQTETNFSSDAGGWKHQLLVGLELGRQATNNFRQRGFFTGVGPDTTSFFVPVQAASISVPIVLRQRPVDITNHGVGRTAALYVQDQIGLNDRWQAIVGARFEYLDVEFENDRTGARLATADRFFSPRLGFIYKPGPAVSLYASYTLSHLPRAGEKLSSLTLENQSLEPEVFENQEIGAKWELANGLTFTLAAYQLDRRKVEAVDASDPSRSVLVDGQQVRGLEAGYAGTVTKNWSMMGGYAYQDGEIRTTQSPLIRAGARLAQLPRHTFSWWNRYDFSARWGAAVGIVYRDRLFAAADNAVTLPGFARVDAALFLTLDPRVKLQLNIENLLDRGYYAMAYSNSNITPGSPRAVRASLTTTF